MDMSESVPLGVDYVAAQSVWTSGAIRNEYVDILQGRSDGAEVRSLPKTFKVIDDWISHKTKGLLKDVVSGDVDPLTVALLVSAVKFKGDWKHKFDVNRTAPGDFFSDGGSKVTRVDFMKAKRKMEVLPSVFELGGASMLRMPYANEEFYATFILPRNNTEASMRDTIESLARPRAWKILGEKELPLREVVLTLPRFSLSYGTVSLKNTLRHLGLKNAFDGTGEFSVMSHDPDVHLDDVLHKVMLEVTEEGTTAAAATVAVMMTRSMPPPPLEINFNRPFLMIVWGRGIPLFIARISDLVDLKEEDEL